MLKFQNNDTIVAISTPPGRGAIGVIRVSGEKAFEIVNKLFKDKNLDKTETHTLHFGTLVGNDKQVIDEVVVSIFKNPYSYTGEDVIEISCHGSYYILNEIVNLIIENGARHAEPGEFTFRAFINNKIDLSQAEAVADIIASETKVAHNIALDQMRGGFSSRLKELRAKLVELSSLIELELDFGEEDVEFASNKQLVNLLNQIKGEVSHLVESFKLGNVIKKGVSVVIAGRPNAGKSTLLNALIEDDRAIVSPIPGTTRDFIEDIITIDGVDFRFIDTAGLTETRDEIEKKGIEKTLERIEKADILIYLFDINELKSEDVTVDLKMLEKNIPVIVVANKIDKSNEKIPFEKSLEKDVIYVSSKYGDNIAQLRNFLVNTLDLENYQGDQSIVTNSRHYEILRKILGSINDIEKGIEQNISKDFIAIDIRQILQNMGEITGEITTNEILGNIFEGFCIGK